jgi:hypothetical protein
VDTCVNEAVKDLISQTGVAVPAMFDCGRDVSNMKACADVVIVA